MINLNAYTLTFDDEFNTLSMDMGHGGIWQPGYHWAPDGSTDPTVSGWTVNPAWAATAAVDANVYSNSGGVTSIAVKPTPADVQPGDVGDKPFLSGMLTTYKSFSQTYGYFEANMKVASGAGINSAFWLLPADGSWPPELDVAEILGRDPTTLVYAAHDSIAGQHVVNPAWAVIPDSSAGFHRYGVDWEPDTITWYVDGQQVGQQTTPAGMNKPMYLLLDTAAGVAGSWLGEPDAGETSAFQVDYVRAYAHKPVTALASTGPATTPDTILIKTSEDAWRGDAQFTVSVDGEQVGGLRTATASHAAGQSTTTSLAADWGVGSHKIGITFVNDAYGGSAQTDRNLWIDQINYDGRSIGGPAALYSNGTMLFDTSPPIASAIHLDLSEDAWRGNAKYAIAVDGVAVGSPGMVTAAHGKAEQAVDLSTLLTPGHHDLAVSFLNDAYGGSARTDRNLYVDSVSINGHTVPSGSAALYNQVTTHFDIIVQPA